MFNIIKSAFNFFKWLFLSIFLICLIVFMVNNRDEVTIHLNPLPFDIQTKMFLVVIFVFILGVLFGVISMSKSLTIKMITNFKDKLKIKKLESKLEKKD